MSHFAGSYAVRVGPRGAIPLPPPWWLAALAADPGGAPGPTLFVIVEDAQEGFFRVVTPDEHLRLFSATAAQPDTEIDAFPVCLTDHGEIPGSDTFDRVPAFAPGQMVMLSGRKAGFSLSPMDETENPIHD
ncbi:hypothetical protein PARPLA_02300 [Rhodobacteraceae bacterium THAF1]|uniref:hypothetical protein n=1 Tax=Palleronia sp. THAF1 TaxID=2587842 RepID=UPI000F3DD9FD|nr:hypothetical protein [Palleronia sp. THAF1]QFU09334.1 hypothetical protein FIU81_11680 [Palleronia sp. THAF1]VDC26781.1 hypothetical protein PARPLA_02300 [Rhodobacteraceae bacterium THAF1]